MIAGRLPVRATLTNQGSWHYCEDHAALIGLSGICPGAAFDLGLAERSVTIQAAYAFGDWPPPGLVYRSPSRVPLGWSPKNPYGLG